MEKKIKVTQQIYIHIYGNRDSIDKIKTTAIINNDYDAIPALYR